MATTKDSLTVYFSDGKAFLEVADNYLMCIGDERFIRQLDPDELWNLVHAVMLEIKFGTRQMPSSLPVSKYVH